MISSQRGARQDTHWQQLRDEHHLATSETANIDPAPADNPIAPFPGFPNLLRVGHAESAPVGNITPHTMEGELTLYTASECNCSAQKSTPNATPTPTPTPTMAINNGTPNITGTPKPPAALIL